MDKDLLQQYRYFLKDSIRKKIDFSRTDQNRGIDVPPVEKPYAADAVRIDLVKPGEWEPIVGIDLSKAIGNRQFLLGVGPKQLVNVIDEPWKKGACFLP